jgi:hypothetical protein
LHGDVPPFPVLASRGLSRRPDGNAASDAVQPAGQRLTSQDGSGSASQDHKSSLKGVLGGMTVAEQSLADAEHHRPMPLDQDRKGGLIVIGQEPR